MARQDIPGLDALGAGYDVFGAFESASSITHPLLDWGNFADWTPDGIRVYGKPNLVEVLEDAQAELYVESGWTFEEFREKLNTKTKLSGGFAFFGGSLEVGFSRDVSRSHEYAYSSVFHRNTQFHLKLKPYARLDMVKRTIKQALERMPPFELFETYGTHFVDSLVVGTKTVATYATDKSRFTSKEKLSIAAEVSYKAFAKIEHRTDLETTVRQFNESSMRHIHVYGGRAEIGTQCESYEQWKAWADTAHRNPMFIGFLDEYSLRPIWELCTDGTRRRVLSDSYKKFAATKTQSTSRATPTPAPKWITDVKVIYGDNKDLDPGVGWQRVNRRDDARVGQDLNEGAGGDYIYLAYQKKPGRTPLTGLQVAYASNRKDVHVPEGYEVVKDDEGEEVDLNKGAHGPFIWLCKTHDPSFAPITGVTVIASDKEVKIGPRNYEGFIPVDLNKGSGGKYIYLCFTRR